MQTQIRGWLGRTWKWVALRGVVAVLFGVLALAMPGITLIALVFMWGAYAITDGILALVAAWQGRGQGRPLWSLVAVGILGIAAGLATFLMPGVTALILLMVIGGWAIGVGVLQVVAAIRLRKEIEGEWALGLSGVLSVAFGILALLWPGAGALAVLGTIGGYSLFFGVVLIVLGFRLRALGQRRLERVGSHRKNAVTSPEIRAKALGSATPTLPR